MGLLSVTPVPLLAILSNNPSLPTKIGYRLASLTVTLGCPLHQISVGLLLEITVAGPNASQMACSGPIGESYLQFCIPCFPYVASGSPFSLCCTSVFDLNVLPLLSEATDTSSVPILTSKGDSVLFHGYVLFASNIRSCQSCTPILGSLLYTTLGDSTSHMPPPLRNILLLSVVLRQCLLLLSLLRYFGYCDTLLLSLWFIVLHIHEPRLFIFGRGVGGLEMVMHTAH